MSVGEAEWEAAAAVGGMACGAQRARYALGVHPW